MSAKSNEEVVKMLYELKLPEAAGRLQELLRSPELSHYSSMQLLREIIEPQYIETMNQRYETNLRLSKLLNKNADVAKLVTSSERRYNEDVVKQLLTFDFIEDRHNVGIYGITEAGKSYFMAAICREACRRNYRCMYVDYCDLMDELLVLNKTETLAQYRKKLKYYSRMQVLCIDDFAISKYTEDGIKILYHLIKSRTDLGTTTLFTSQYDPSEWGKHLSREEDCYGKLDGIRRRLTAGFTVYIEKL